MTVGGQEPAACPECGENDWRLERRSFPRKILGWPGSGRWPADERVCGRCGLRTGESAVATYALLRTSASGAPVRVLRVLRRRRTIIPVPMTYLMAAALGIAIGILLQLVLGWPWWLVALAVVGAVWLLFASSAFWSHPGRDLGRGLRTEILDAIDPAGALERDARITERIFRAAPFRLLGLSPSWAGPRMVGGWGGQSGRVTSLELVHGDPLERDDPELSVEVGSEPLRGLRELALDLWREEDRPPEDLSPELTGAWMHERWQRLQARPDPPWDEIATDVDGHLVPFRSLALRDRWVASGEVEGLTVTLRGRRFPRAQVQLVAVSDVEPYLEGYRRHLDRARGLHGH